MTNAVPGKSISANGRGQRDAAIKMLTPRWPQVGCLPPLHLSRLRMSLMLEEMLTKLFYGGTMTQAKYKEYLLNH